MRCTPWHLVMHHVYLLEDWRLMRIWTPFYLLKWNITFCDVTFWTRPFWLSKIWATQKFGGYGSVNQNEIMFEENSEEASRKSVAYSQWNGCWGEQQGRWLGEKEQENREKCAEPLKKRATDQKIRKFLKNQLQNKKRVVIYALVVTAKTWRSLKNRNKTICVGTVERLKRNLKRL